jgi:hypothetical protein
MRRALHPPPPSPHPTHHRQIRNPITTIALGIDDLLEDLHVLQGAVGSPGAGPGAGPMGWTTGSGVAFLAAATPGASPWRGHLTSTHAGVPIRSWPTSSAGSTGLRAASDQAPSMYSGHGGPRGRGGSGNSALDGRPVVKRPAPGDLALVASGDGGASPSYALQAARSLSTATASRHLPPTRPAVVTAPSQRVTAGIALAAPVAATGAVDPSLRLSVPAGQGTADAAIGMVPTTTDPSARGPGDDAGVSVAVNVNAADTPATTPPPPFDGSVAVDLAGLSATLAALTLAPKPPAAVADENAALAAPSGGSSLPPPTVGGGSDAAGGAADASGGSGRSGPADDTNTSPSVVASS